MSIKTSVSHIVNVLANNHLLDSIEEENIITKVSVLLKKWEREHGKSTKNSVLIALVAVFVTLQIYNIDIANDLKEFLYIACDLSETVKAHCKVNIDEFIPLLMEFYESIIRDYHTVSEFKTQHVDLKGWSDVSSSSSASSDLARSYFFNVYKQIHPDENYYCDYVVIKEVGSGTYGKVKMAYKNATIHAIKVMDISMSIDGSPWFPDYVLNEVANQIYLQKHPNVLPILDFLMRCPGQESTIGLVLPLANYTLGDSLKTQVLKFGQLSSDKVHLKQLQTSMSSREYRLSIAKDIACALTYIHAMNFAHLDLKPQNILLMENGRAVLGDFGLSTNLESNKFNPSHMVTYPWKSPELACGLQKYYEGATAYASSPSPKDTKDSTGSKRSKASTKPDFDLSATDVWSYGIISAQLFFDIPPLHELSPTSSHVPEIALAPYIFNRFGLPFGFQNKLKQSYEHKLSYEEIANGVPNFDQTFKFPHVAWCVLAASHGKAGEFKSLESILSDEERAFFIRYYGEATYRKLWQVINGALQVNPLDRITMGEISAILNEIKVDPSFDHICPTLSAPEHKGTRTFKEIDYHEFKPYAHISSSNYVHRMAKAIAYKVKDFLKTIGAVDIYIVTCYYIAVTLFHETSSFFEKQTKRDMDHIRVLSSNLALSLKFEFWDIYYNL